MRTSTIFLAVLVLAMTACSGCQPEKGGGQHPVSIDENSIKLTLKPLSPDRPYTYYLEIHCDCDGFQGSALELEASGPGYATTQRLVEFTLKGTARVLIDGQAGGFGDIRKIRIYPADATGHTNTAPLDTMVLEGNRDGTFDTDPAQIFLPRPVKGRITREGEAYKVLIEAKPDGLYLNGKLAAKKE